MHKWIGTICILWGAALVLSALLLLGYNRMEDKKAGEAAEAVMVDLQQVIEQKSADIKEYNKQEEVDSNSENTDEANEKFPFLENDKETVVVAEDGYEYIGVLSIPVLELELPVMAQWDYKRLKLAPCRQYGSAESDDIIIAAHNYERHFGKLSELVDGNQIIFTNMDGVIYEYAVRESMILQPTEVDKVVNSDWELILYTCTYGGKTRVVVGCERLE